MLPGTAIIIPLVAIKVKSVEKNHRLFIGVSKVLQINSKYPRKSMLLAKHSRNLEETYHA